MAAVLGLDHLRGQGVGDNGRKRDKISYDATTVIQTRTDNDLYQAYRMEVVTSDSNPDIF